jgi:hypothetical protein
MGFCHRVGCNNGVGGYWRRKGEVFILLHSNCWPSQTCMSEFLNMVNFPIPWSKV